MRALPLVVVLLAASSSRAAEQGWVVLPVEEYKALRTVAKPLPEPTPKPPHAVVLSRVDYDLDVGTDSALGEARLTAEVYAEGWVRLPLPAGLRISRAWLDARPVPVLRMADGKSSEPVVLLSRAGRSTLRLEIAVAITASGGEEMLSLPTGPMTRATLRIRRASVDVRARGGLVLERSESAGVARVVAHGTGAAPLVLTWGRRREAATALPLRWRGNLTELVSLAEDSAQVSAEVSADVLQGAMPSVRIGLPATFVVNEVRGPAVADWEVASGHLNITFLELVEGKVAVTLTGETPTQREGVVVVPILRLPDAERESGGIAVEVQGSGQIERQDPRGLDSADPSELGSTIATRDAVSLVAYRFRPGAGSAERALSVGVARYTAAEVLETNVEEARFSALLTAEGHTLVEARYSVRNRSRSFLTVTLPESAVLWSATVSGRPVRPGQASGSALLLPLDKAGGSGNPPPFAVDVVYLDRAAAWTNEGGASFALPSLDLPVGRAGLVLHHPEDFRLTTKPGPFRQEAFREPESSALRPARSAGYGEAFEGGIPGGVVGGVVGGMPSAPPPPQAQAQLANKAAPPEDLKALADRFQRESRVGERVTGVLPVQVPFPPFGPSIFLAAELQAEGQAPSLAFDYKKEKR